MTRRKKIWLVVAALFTVVNLVSTGFAAAANETMHAAVHVALTLVGAYFTWRLAPRSQPDSQVDLPSVDESRLEQLQQSVDAVALEVERIGEAQRFSDKLQAERVEPRR